MARELKTLDDVEEVLAEMGQLDALEAEIDAETNDLIGKLKDSAAERKVKRVGRSTVSFADTRAEQFAAVEAYCESHRDELLKADAKSLKLRNGTIGWRKQKDSIKPKDGKTEGDVLGTLVAKLAKVMNTALKAVRLVTGLPWSTVVSFTPSLNKTGLLSAIAQQQISPAKLEKIGLQLVPGEDRFFADPAKPVLESHPAETG